MKDSEARRDRRRGRSSRSDEHDECTVECEREQHGEPDARPDPPARFPTADPRDVGEQDSDDEGGFQAIVHELRDRISDARRAVEASDAP